MAMVTKKPTRSAAERILNRKPQSLKEWESDDEDAFYLFQTHADSIGSHINSLKATNEVRDIQALMKSFIGRYDWVSREYESVSHLWRLFDKSQQDRSVQYVRAMAQAANSVDYMETAVSRADWNQFFEELVKLKTALQAAQKARNSQSW